MFQLSTSLGWCTEIESELAVILDKHLISTILPAQKMEVIDIWFHCSFFFVDSDWIYLPPGFLHQCYNCQQMYSHWILIFSIWNNWYWCSKLLLNSGSQYDEGLIWSDYVLTKQIKFVMKWVCFMNISIPISVRRIDKLS